MSLHELIAAIGEYKYWHKEKSSTCGGRKRHGRDLDNDDEKDNAISLATREMLLQIASGVRHLHSLRIVHRDLKVCTYMHSSRLAFASLLVHLVFLCGKANIPTYLSLSLSVNLFCFATLHAPCLYCRH